MTGLFKNVLMKVVAADNAASRRVFSQVAFKKIRKIFVRDTRYQGQYLNAQKRCTIVA
jgi:hypothetical protein